MFKKILLGAAALLLTAAALFVALIGPWPVYGERDIASASFYQATVQRIEEAAPGPPEAIEPRRLQAGWAVQDMTPPPGAPLAGYGARPGDKRATGVRDPLKAKAVALSDGGNTVVVLGTDMLIIPPNIAGWTVDAVRQATDLDAHNIYFTATHTHCGPGGFADGFASRMSGGPHAPDTANALAGAFAQAIIEAYENMAPARLAHGSVDAEEFIRNRVRDGGAVDSALNYMVIEREDGDRCYMARFSGHPTVFGADMMEFSAEFPGEMMRHIEEQTGATAVYLGGAVGSMSARAPGGDDTGERVVALGEALGELVLEAAADLAFTDDVEVMSLAIPVETPSFQIRPVSPNWRLSPFAPRLLGLESEGWLQAARIGDMLLFGLPFDVSGELAKDWREAAAQQGWDLWVTSFSPGYLGYLSPDEYYNEIEENGRLGYEIGLMNWVGPNGAEYFESLLRHIKERLGPAPTAERQPAGATDARLHCGAQILVASEPLHAQ